MQFKIMNYNILHGFHKTKSNKFDPIRFRAAQKVIEEENPDILVLTEAAFGGKNQTEIFVDYAKLFDFAHSYFSPRKNEWGTCVLSRFPIEGYSLMSFPKTRINLEGKTLYLDVIHPHPSLTEDEKIEEVKPILENSQTPYILTGDFNSLSDEDSYDREKLIVGFKRFNSNVEQTVDEFLKRKLIPYIKTHGLRDAFPEEARRFTMPTLMYGTQRESAMRIDYFFISENVKVLETRVIKNPLTEIASDHYPVVGVFEITSS